MRSKLANPNHCAVPFFSRATANLCWYYVQLTQVLICVLLSGLKIRFSALNQCEYTIVPSQVGGGAA